MTVGHLRPRDRAERKGEALFADARRVEQIADYQQHVDVAIVRDVDDAAERIAHFVAQLNSALAGPERVGLEVNIGSMNDGEGAMRRLSWQNCFLRRANRLAGAQFRSMTTCCRVKVY